MARRHLRRPVRLLIGAAVAVIVLVAALLANRSTVASNALLRGAGSGSTARYAAPGTTPADAMASPAPTSRRGRSGRARGRRAAGASATPGAPTTNSLAPPWGAPAGAEKVIVGVGDSIPAGTNCPGCTTYVDLVGRRFAAAAGSGAVVYNHAVAEITTSGVLDQLQSTTLRRRLARADLVVLTIGANDVDPGPLGDPACAGEALAGCYAGELGALESRLRQLEKTVAGLLKPGARVVVTDYWNVLTDGAVGRAEGPAWVAGADALTLLTNAVIERVTHEGSGLFVEVRPAFRGADGSRDMTALLADDGEHLDAAGHQVMADVIMTALG